MILGLAQASAIVSREQLAALEDAIETRHVSAEVYREAVDATIECMREAGIDVVGPLHDDSWGYPRLSYVAQVGWDGESTVVNATEGVDVEYVGPAGGPEPSLDPDALIADNCRERNSEFLEYAYDAQPSSVDAYDQILESKRDAVTACGDKHGVEADPSLDIRSFLFQYTQTPAGRECLQASGINGF